MFAMGPGLISMLMLVMITITTALTLLDADDLDHVSVYTDILCPYNMICREGDPKLTVARSDSTGCCTDCSCADDCGLREDCCYPELDRYRLVDRSHQRCIYPTTTKLQEGTAYNMVVDEYPYVTGEAGTTAGTPCGEDKTASRLGALYPVFAPKTGRIYVNIKCARVHGLNEADIIIWRAYLACEDSWFIDVSTYFQYFANGIMTPACTFKFVYPGPLSDLKTERCYPGTSIGTCPANADFMIPDGLNMTRGEIVEACRSNLTSSIRWGSKWYKNVFCRLCDKTFSEYIPSHTCPRLEEVDDLRMQETSFLALIDPYVSTMGSATSKPHPITRTACSQKNKTDCRLAYCPSGQFSDTGARCDYASKHWRTRSVGMYLKLIPRHPVTLSTARDADFATVLANPRLSISPWSIGWSVESLVTFPRTDAKNLTHVEYFLVRLTYGQLFHAEPVLRDIDNALKLDWFLFLNNSLLGHRQEFSEYKRFVEPGFNPNRTSFPEFVYLEHSPESARFMRNIPVPEYEILYRKDGIKPISIVITKMFFCDQVLLRPEEYQMDTNYMFLQLNTGRIFYPSEVAIWQDEDLTMAPKVCCSDVGFHVVLPMSGLAQLVATEAWLMVLLGALVAFWV